MGKSLVAVLIKDGEELAEWGEGRGSRSWSAPNIAYCGLTGERILSQMPRECKLSVESHGSPQN